MIGIAVVVRDVIDAIDFALVVVVAAVVEVAKCLVDSSFVMALSPVLALCSRAGLDYLLVLYYSYFIKSLVIEQFYIFCKQIY